jgi:hypothetical protein
LITNTQGNCQAYLWLVQRKQLKNQPVEKHQANNWPPRQLARVHQPPVESRNHIVIVPVQWLALREIRRYQKSTELLDK